MIIREITDKRNYSILKINLEESDHRFQHAAFYALDYFLKKKAVKLISVSIGLCHDPNNYFLYRNSLFNLLTSEYNCLKKIEIISVKNKAKKNLEYILSLFPELSNWQFLSEEELEIMRELSSKINIVGYPGDKDISFLKKATELYKTKYKTNNLLPVLISGVSKTYRELQRELAARLKKHKKTN